MTKKMKLCAEYMALHPTYSQVKVARDLEFRQENIVRWFKDPEFNEYLEEQRRVVWKDYAHECQELMMQLADQGNFQAIKYILDSNGYAAAQKVELDSNVIKVSIDE